MRIEKETNTIHLVGYPVLILNNLWSVFYNIFKSILSFFTNKKFFFIVLKFQQAALGRVFGHYANFAFLLCESSRFGGAECGCGAISRVHRLRGQIEQQACDLCRYEFNQ